MGANRSVIIHWNWNDLDVIDRGDVKESLSMDMDYVHIHRGVFFARHLRRVLLEG